MQKRVSKTVDMTEGRLLTKIIGFAFPVCLGLLFQQLYNLADTIIVGRMLGVNALAGVGSTTGLTFFAFSISNSLGNGFAVSISQRFGADDNEGIKKYFGNAIALSAILSVVFTVLTIFLTRPVLNLTKTPDEIYSFAYNYVIVIFAGLACTVFYNLLAASLRALGDSRTPVIVLIIASVVNIVLDIVMIGTLKMGVAGAALATVVSQLISVIFLAGYIVYNNDMLRITLRDIRIWQNVSREQLMTAIPMALQGAVIALGILIVQASINAMGTVYVAGSTAGNKLYGIMAAPIDSVCQAMIPIAGQNYGAGKYDRIDKGLRMVNIIGWSLTIVLSIAAYFFGPAMMRLFIATSEAEVIKYGHRFLLFYVMGYGFLTIQMSFCFALQGSGNAKMTVMSGILETAGRLVGAVVIAGMYGYIGVCLALPLAWVFTSAYIIPAYILCRKRMTGKRNSFNGEAAII